MIEAQESYQADTKVVSTTSTVLQSLVQMQISAAGRLPGMLPHTPSAGVSGVFTVVVGVMCIDLATVDIAVVVVANDSSCPAATSMMLLAARTACGPLATDRPETPW